MIKRYMLCLFCVLLPAALAAADVVTIEQLQTGAVAEGTTVTLSGVVVTASTSYGLAVAEAPYTALHGIWVYTGDDPGVQAGDVVDVTGDYVEYFELSEVNVADSTDPGAGVTVTGATSVPPPSDVTIDDLLDATEEWEGCVVRVVTPLTVVDDDLGYGEWLVEADDGSRSFRCDDMWYQGTVLIGHHYMAVTGLWHYTYGNYKLEVFADGIDPDNPTAGRATSWSLVKSLYR